MVGVRLGYALFKWMGVAAKLKNGRGVGRLAGTSTVPPQSRIVQSEGPSRNATCVRHLGFPAPSLYLSGDVTGL